MFDKRLLQLVPNGRRGVIGAVALRWLALLAQVGLFASMGTLLGEALAGSEPSIGGCGLVMLACAVLWLAFSALGNYSAARAGAAVKSTVTQAIFDKVTRLGSLRDKVMGAEQIAQLTGEGVEMLKPYFSQYLPQFFFAVLAPLTLFFITLPICWPVAVTLLVCVPLMPASIMILMTKAKRFMGDYWGTYVDLGAAFMDAISGLTTLKIYGTDAAEQEHLDSQAEEFRQITMALLRMQLGSVAFMDLFTYGGMALGLVVTALQVASGALSLSNALVLALLCGSFFMPMRTFGSYFHTGMNASSVIDQLFTLLEAAEPSVGKANVEGTLMDIEIEGLSFTYGEGQDPALRDVCLHIFPNSFIGVVGASGSGKSTLAHLLAGDLWGYEGSVRFNGVELKDIAPAAMQELVTVVSHSSHVFAGTVRSNLQLARPDATNPQLWYALRQAKLDDFVLSIGGLDAPVKEGGANLSGGQRQRLCIARGILRDTPVYIFDEATSNVDAESEAKLLEVIQGIALRKSVIMVTHRLKSLEFADEIVVMEKGAAVQQGTHRQLLARQGAYRAMWEQTSQLEAFAQQVEDAFPQKEPEADPIKEALAQMPGMMGNMMEAFASIIDGEKYNDAPNLEFPLGHPAWIPLPNYEVGMSKGGAAAGEELEDAEEGAANGGEAGAEAAKAAGSADSSSSAFASATLGTGGMSGMNMEAIRDALEVVRSSIKVRPVGQIAVEPPAPPSRKAGVITAGLLRLTRSRLPEFLVAALLGVAGWACAIGVLGFGACALLAATGMPAPMDVFTGLLACAACGVVRGLLHYGERLLTHDQTFRTLALIRSRIFAKMRQLAPAKLEGRDSGDLIALLTSDVELLEGFYSRSCTPVMTAIMVALVSTVALACTAWQLGLLALIAYVVCGVVIPVISTAATRERGAELRAYAVAMTSFLLDSMAGMADLLHYGRAQEYSEELNDHLDSLEGGESGFGRLSAFLGVLPQWSAYVFGLLFVVAGALLASAGVVAGTAVAVCAVAFIASLDAVVAASNVGFSLHQTLAAADRVLDVLEEEPQVAEVADGVDVGSFSGLEVQDLEFGYGSGPVLSDISFTADSGMFVGITGKSGVGKSTLLKLLMRFWDADAGKVLVSGADIASVNTSSLRRLQSYMTQDTYLFEGTLRRNLLVAKADATEEELLVALDKAALGELLASLPQGLDTPITGGGAGLSDGQRQRVGLAQAFLHNAPLMLLDEPTSSLDSLNEAAVLQALCTHAEGKTVIIVSHRKAVAAIVDKLLVIDEDRDS